MTAIRYEVGPCRREHPSTRRWRRRSSAGAIFATPSASSGRRRSSCRSKRRLCASDGAFGAPGPQVARGRRPVAASYSRGVDEHRSRRRPETARADAVAARRQAFGSATWPRSRRSRRADPDCSFERLPRRGGHGAGRLRQVDLSGGVGACRGSSCGLGLPRPARRRSSGPVSLLAYAYARVDPGGADLVAGMSGPGISVLGRAAPRLAAAFRRSPTPFVFMLDDLHELRIAGLPRRAGPRDLQGPQGIPVRDRKSFRAAAPAPVAGVGRCGGIHGCRPGVGRGRRPADLCRGGRWPDV